MINSITVVGRLSECIELKEIAGDKFVCNFSIANKSNIKNTSGEYILHWIYCEAWNIQAQYLFNYSNKGDLLTLNGRLVQKKYEVNGQPREKHVVLVQDAHVSSKKNILQSSIEDGVVE